MADNINKQALDALQSSSEHRDLIKLEEGLGTPPPRWATAITKIGAIIVGFAAIESVALGVYGMMTGRAYNYGLLKDSSGFIRRQVSETMARKIGVANLAVGLGLGVLSVGASASAGTAERGRNLLRLYDKTNSKEVAQGKS